MAAWFDPSGIAGMSLDLNAEYGVTGTATVTAWANQAGAGSFSATGTACPSLSLTGIHGRKAISFNGTTNVLTSALTIGNVLGAGSYTLFALATHVAGGLDGSISNKPAVLNDNGTFWNGPTLDAQTPSMVAGQFDTAEHTTAPIGITLGTPSVMMVRFDGTTITSQVDGGTAQTVSSGAIGSQTPTMVMGANWNSTVFGQMLIRRVLVWKAALTQDQQNLIRFYLNGY